MCLRYNNCSTGSKSNKKMRTFCKCGVKFWPCWNLWQHSTNFTRARIKSNALMKKQYFIWNVKRYCVHLKYSQVEFNVEEKHKHEYLKTLYTGRILKSRGILQNTCEGEEWSQLGTDFLNTFIDHNGIVIKLCWTSLFLPRLGKKKSVFQTPWEFLLKKKIIIKKQFSPKPNFLQFIPTAACLS